MTTVRRWAREEGGSGTILVLLCCVLVTMLAVAGMVLVSVLLVRTRVAAAADLGSLAAASAALEPEATACARAREVVRANGAVLVSCRIEGARARVEVVGRAPRAVPLLTGRTSQVHARAQAELVPAGDP